MYRYQRTAAQIPGNGRTVGIREGRNGIGCGRCRCNIHRDHRSRSAEGGSIGQGSADGPASGYGQRQGGGGALRAAIGAAAAQCCSGTRVNHHIQQRGSCRGAAVAIHIIYRYRLCTRCMPGYINGIGSGAADDRTPARNNPVISRHASFGGIGTRSHAGR